MSTFELSVSRNGKFLFRVEEQSTYPDDEAMETLSNLIVERFPASEGFQVVRVVWPDRLGDMKNLSEVRA